MHQVQIEREEKEAEMLLSGSWNMSWNPYFGLYNPALNLASGYIPTRSVDDIMDMAALAEEGDCAEEEE